MFIIRTFPRCGTHMVRTALNQHPNLYCHDEIFNPDTKPLDEITSRGPCGQLEHYVNAAGVGCVMHAYTAAEQFEGSRLHQLAWDYVATHQDRYKIIVLNRKDWLRRAASVALARQTNRWHRWQSEQNDTPASSVEIHPDFLEWHFRCQAASLADTQTRFSAAPLYWYEDLVDNWAAVMQGIQQSLGVRPRVLSPRTRKQDQRPIQEIIGNYAKLRRVFAGTHWAHLFDVAEANDEQREV